MTAALEAALDLARRGVYILPLIGKVPHANLTPHGVKDASVDVDQIVRWFSRNPSANIGIALGVGELTSVRVLDSDPRHGGDSSRARLIEEHGELPPTLTVRTGRGDGGMHEYWSFPPGAYREKICGRHGGIDLLGPGKYVVGPTSVHPETGGKYEVISDHEVGISAAPPWLVALAAKVHVSPVAAGPGGAIPSTPLIERVRRYLAKCDPAISGSGGHNATFVVAQKLVRGFELDTATAYALMREEYNPRCKPSWSERDLRRKVEEAARFGRMPLGSLLRADTSRRNPPR